MSGIDVLNAPQDLELQTITQDPAVSLREAALRTLKSKRRKLNTHPSSDFPPTYLQRPAASHPASIQLDYGQAEPSDESQPASSAAVAPSVSDSAAMDVDEDGQAKEEGEISDSETAPATPFQPPPKDLPVNSSPLQPPEKTAPLRRAVAPSVASPLKASIVVKTEHPPVAIPEPNVVASTDDYDRLPFNPDLGFVRPGLASTSITLRPSRNHTHLLAVSQGQYDTVKELILEVLGWGVPPDYLVKCGISREVVYYTFLDLKLQLPENVSTSDLPPLEELVARASAFVSNRSQSPAMQHATRPRSTSRTGVESPAPADVPRTTLSPSAQPFVPVNLANSDLLDMEQQRRQQLLARKVAQASRKVKHATSPESISHQHSETVVASRVDHSLSAPPHVAVDDFLNSIEPAKDISREGSRAPVDLIDGHDAMDVDGPPGLSVVSVALPVSDQGGANLARFPTQEVTSTSATTSSTRALRSSPSTLHRTDTITSSSSSSSGSATPPVGSGRSANLRRGTKRPVAADFVDMEPDSSHATKERNGLPPQSYHHHHPHHHHHGHKKKPASFAVVSSKPRRMVIDLTDSEGEEDGADSLSRPRAGSRQPSQANVVPVQNAQNQLVEREREIQALKDRIAKKELEARLKREAAVRFSCVVNFPTLSDQNSAGIWSRYAVIWRHSCRIFHRCHCEG